MANTKKQRAVFSTVGRLLKYALLTACGGVLFYVGNRIATARRGYAAIGGEMVFLLLPVFYQVGKTTIDDYRRERARREP